MYGVARFFKKIKRVRNAMKNVLEGGDVMRIRRRVKNTFTKRGCYEEEVVGTVALCVVASRFHRSGSFLLLLLLLFTVHILRWKFSYTACSMIHSYFHLDRSSFSFPIHSYTLMNYSRFDDAPFFRGGYQSTTLRGKDE